MIETLSRTKESVARATRLAINVPSMGLQVRLWNFSYGSRKLSLISTVKWICSFLLIRSHNVSIAKEEHSKWSIFEVKPALCTFLPCRQHCLSAAAPPGTVARENRRQCCKVLKLWLERKIFPDSLLRRYIGDISASGDGATVGFPTTSF